MKLKQKPKPKQANQLDPDAEGVALAMIEESALRIWQDVREQRKSLNSGEMVKKIERRLASLYGKLFVVKAFEKSRRNRERRFFPSSQPLQPDEDL